MTALVELLRRVEGLTGPDREVDAAVALRFGWSVYPGDNWIGPNAEICVPSYTASIDAALALLERVLPGWWWVIAPTPKGARSEVAKTILSNFWTGDAATPPLAILATLLSALIAIEEARAPADEVEG